MQDNLPELRDIHLPVDDISVFPLAYGWWITLAVIGGVCLVARLVRLLLRKSKKRYAMKLLESARQPEITSAVKMSEILRRICVYKYKRAAALFGKDWIDFLNSRSKKKIEGKTAQLLLDAPYVNAGSQVYDGGDVAELYNFCQSWIGENL